MRYSRQSIIKGSREVEDTKTAKPNLKKLIAVFLFLALIFGVTNELLAGINLEVPLEMVDFGLESGTSVRSFERTYMFMDASNYDGATYYFEIVAKNTHATNAYTVYLVDVDNNMDMASITIPANTTIFTRYRSSNWTPNSGKITYQVKIGATAAVANVVVQTARIIVQQTNATKTRIQIPLVQKDNDVAGNPAGSVDTTNSQTYTQGGDNKYALWKKDIGVYSDLAATNPWTLEAVLDNNTALYTTYAALFNATDNTQVAGAQLQVSSTAATLKDVSFADNAANFHNLDNFEVRIRTSYSGTTAELLSAVRLYVTLTNLTQAEVLYRISQKHGPVTTARDIVEQRVLLDTSLFNEPIVYFEASGYCADNAQRVFLRDHSTNDSGTGGSDVTDSGINFNSGTKGIIRTSVISPTSGNRFYVRTDASTNNLSLNHAWIVVQAGPVRTVIGNGTDPGNVTLAPGDTATELDAFTLQTSSGTDGITGVTVTLSSGSSGGLSKVEITSDDGLTSYGYVDNPLSDTVAISVTGMPTVITAPTQYKVMITPRPHTGTNKMPDPPGSTYNVTGTVTGITSTNPKIYDDLGSATITIDNQSPSNPTNFNGNASEGKVALTWSNPSDCNQIIILRSNAAIADIPEEGASYNKYDPIGSSTVMYVHTGAPSCSATSYDDTEVTDGQTYYYKIFAKDLYGNYSSDPSGTVRGTPAGPFTPGPVVTVSSGGTQVATMEIGLTSQNIGARFKFQQSSGTPDTITALTISETGNADADAVLHAHVYYESDKASCTYNGNETEIPGTFNFNSQKVVLDPISIPLSMLSPDNHFTCVYVFLDVDQSAVNGSTVDLEITSSDDFTLSSLVNKAGTPLALPGTTTLVDTTPPGNITGLTVTPGDSQITFDWTNPADYDFVGVIVKRSTAGIPANCSGGTIVSKPYTNSGLTNGTKYYYRFCSYDEVPNYSTGVTASATPSLVPVLEYPPAPYDDGKDPDTGYTSTDFRFKVIYYDWQNDAPAFVKINIGDNDGLDDDMFSYDMSLDTSAAPTLHDGIYSNGEQYVYGPIGLGAAADLRFYFKAQAATGDTNEVYLPSDALTGGYNTGPTVSLLEDSINFIGEYNMVGVPKDLSSGYTYVSVLGDDSGYSNCQFWDSYGLDTLGGYLGDYVNCTSDNLENGKGYYIFALYGYGPYRLDEPSGVGNVAALSVDIALDPDGGWTMISNPYNARIKLQDVKVIRQGDVTEYSFSQAVTNDWIVNSIYEWEGSVSGYIAKAFNGSTPAVLEPWVGYFIYVKDDTTPITLRVNKP